MKDDRLKAGSDFYIDGDFRSAGVERVLRLILGGTDQSMVAEDTSGFDKGGIDLNPQSINLNVLGNTKSMKIPPVHLDHAVNVENFCNGLVPMIIYISPVTNVLSLLGNTDRAYSQRKTILNR